MNPEISATEFKQLLNAQSDADRPVVIVDCREQEEHDLVHIEGAILVPISEFSQRSQELEGMKDRHLVVYCHLGMRSLNAVAWLREQGFSQAQSLSGGIDAWAAEIDPSLKRY